MSRANRSVRDSLRALQQLPTSPRAAISQSSTTQNPRSSSQNNRFDNTPVANDIPSGSSLNGNLNLWGENIHLRIQKETTQNLNEFYGIVKEEIATIRSRVNLFGSIALGIITIVTIGMIGFMASKWIDNQDRMMKFEMKLEQTNEWKSTLSQKINELAEKIAAKKK